MTISQGDIALIGMNTVGADWIAFVALNPIAAGETIYFTDNELTSATATSFNSGESYFKWVAPAGGVAAGTVIQIGIPGAQTSNPSATTGTSTWVTSAGNTNPGLSSTADSVYAFTAASDATVSTPVTHLAYINLGNAVDGIAPASLDAKYKFSVTDGSDNAYFTGPRSGYPNYKDYAALIGTASNWTRALNELTYGSAQSGSFVQTPLGSLSVDSPSVTEGNSGTKVLTFTVTLSSASVQTVTVDYATVNGTALSGSDFVAASGTLTFAAGETSKTVSVTINGDTALEGDETLTLHLSNVVNATINVADGTGTIINDDVTLAGDDHYSVAAGTTLSTSGTPFTIDASVAAAAGGIVLTNDGTIASTAAAAIEVPAATPVAGAASFTLNNTGTVTGATNGVHVASDLGGGTLTVVNSGTINGTATRAIDVATVAAGETIAITNAAGGIIHSANDAVRVTGAAAFNGTLSLTNSGTIEALGTGQGVDLAQLLATAAAHVTITNNATGQIIGDDNDGLRPSANATVENYGLIRGKTAGSTGADGIDYGTSDGVVINNHAGAKIEGARHGVTGKLPAGFDNAGSIIGNGGSGLNLDTAGTTITTILNEATGTIIGTANGLTDGDGIDVDGQVNITNYGTINAFGHTVGENNEGLAIGGGTVVNYGTIYSDERGIRSDDSNSGNAFAGLNLTNHGTITGTTLEAISITDNQGDTILNAADGTINGDIVTGSGDDTVTNLGVLNGNIATGDGNDTITAGAGSQTITGGAGNDTIDGGAGDDTAIFAGTIAGSTISRTGATFTITGSDGTDTLTNVEHFQFSDGTVDASSINTAPAIDSNGGGSSAAVTVAENKAAVTTVHATDAEGDAVTYSIAGGADAALFQIDASTGALTFKNAPNYEAPADAGHDNVYNVTVRASDGVANTDQALSVTVTDVADTHSSQAAYLLSSDANVTIKAIITTGDATSKVGGGTYLYGGIPDGLGLFDNGDGTVTVLSNHEINSTLGTVRADGAKGAYVSELVIDKATLSVISGQDAIQTLKLWNGTSFVTSTLALSRFCSADLPSQSALYNAATGLGTTAKIFFTGEESGAEGKQLGVVVSGAEKGIAYELPWLGKFSHENAVANAYAQDKTIVLGTDDAGGGKGQVYVYVGTKQATGTEVDKAGLTNGQLYGFAVTGLTQETETTNLQNADFTLAALGDVSGKTGAQLETASNAAGVTQFLRPEDIAWDPTNAARGYFVVTDNVATNGTTGTYHSRLYQFTFNDITHPELGGKISAVLDGTEGQVMFDNITVDAQGKVTLCEDPGNNVRVGRVWQYDPVTDALKEIAHHDPALFLQNPDPLQPGYTVDPTKYQTQDEESSGVLDVTATFGDAHHKAFLIDTQNHAAASGPNAATLVEGGQLQLITQYFNTAPAIDSNGGGSSAAVSVAECPSSEHLAQLAA